MKKFFQEFKEFALKGNIIDMAVGVIIGGAFGKIVTSLVDNIISPLIGLLTGSVNLSELSATIGSGDTAAVLTYGAFIQSIIDFLIIALSIFAVLKLIMTAKTKLESLKKQEEEAAEEEAGPSTEELLAEIRDLLKDK